MNTSQETQPVIDGMKRATMQLLLLKMLDKKDRTLGELSQEIRDLSDGVLDIHTPYGSLQKLLLDKSVVEKGSRISSDGRVRTFYGITQKGRERMTAQESVLIRCMDSIYGFFRENAAG